MRVLDIGCGCGSFMAYAAERYGARCARISISAEQIAWARARCRDPGNSPFDDYLF